MKESLDKTRVRNGNGFFAFRTSFYSKSLKEGVMDDSVSKTDFFQKPYTQACFQNIKPTAFVKKVDDIVAHKQANVLFKKSFDIFWGITESEYQKKLRQNSRKYHKRILKKYKNKCAICSWGEGFKDCLQIHHILPVKKYFRVFYEAMEIPDSAFEESNLIVLCPNCHTLIHKLRNETRGGEMTPKALAIWNYFSTKNERNDLFDFVFSIMNSLLFHKQYESASNNLFSKSQTTPE